MAESVTVISCPDHAACNVKLHLSSNPGRKAIKVPYWAQEWYRANQNLVKGRHFVQIDHDVPDGAVPSVAPLVEGRNSYADVRGFLEDMAGSLYDGYAAASAWGEEAAEAVSGVWDQVRMLQQEILDLREMLPPRYHR
ncbi:MAG: hypothetical protein GTO63_12880, partial [Anaerolineae bacterium]|nr:hypothetical protein [Anaerolineae bacterium]NIN95738.1 hypothetical protein [Anaerolineae bacterium]